MKLHEYQVKQLFAKHNLPIPTGYVCKTIKEAEEAMIKLGNFPLVVKCQVHSGGRGKKGAIKIVKNYDEIRMFAETWLTKRLVTQQTDLRGYPVNQILIETAMDIEKELYLGMIIDHTTCQMICIVSIAGGIEIEEVLKKAPKIIHKATIDPLIGPMPYQGRDLAFKLGLTGKQVEEFSNIFIGLASMFLKYDLSLLEINPLIVNNQGNLICLDGKISVDKNALYRQIELQKLRDFSQEDPREIYASELELHYVALDGNIGCMVNGAGLGMGTMDILKFHGIAPANFLDIGGKVTKEKVIEAFRIMLFDNNISAILINIFGGIVRCDLISDGIISAIKETGLKIPVIVRLEGNNAKLGIKKIEDSSLKITVAISLIDAVKKIIKTVRGKISRGK